ncbi:MAG TPA: hypothetical protein VIW73_09775, partial [Candidatus Cybelea sp.]
EGARLDDRDMLVAGVPEAVSRLGIGAFISPQWLAGEEDGVVLDFVRREMRREPWSEAAGEVARAGGVAIGGDGVRRCENRGKRPVDRILASARGHVQDVVRGGEQSEAIRRQAMARFAQRRGPAAFASRPWD